MKIEKIIVYLCKTGKPIEKIERKNMKEKKENSDCCPENTHKHFREGKTLSKIINDTVTESLKYCLKTHIENTFRTANLDEKLTSLFSQADNENPFNEKETHFLVEQINRLKILDLTVGNGTLLVEVLNKLTFLLSKLDPLNEKWKQQQIRALDRIADPTSKSELHETIETVFNQNAPDYARKRYLIQNCLYGICNDHSSLNAAKLNLLNCLLEEQEAARNTNTPCRYRLLVPSRNPSVDRKCTNRIIQTSRRGTLPHQPVGRWVQSRTIVRNRKQKHHPSKKPEIVSHNVGNVQQPVSL